MDFDDQQTLSVTTISAAVSPTSSISKMQIRRVLGYYFSSLQVVSYLRVPTNSACTSITSVHDPGQKTASTEPHEKKNQQVPPESFTGQISELEIVLAST